jgi:hypothetical protein
MHDITVAIVSLHVTANTVVWQIKRVAPGKPWLGWATGTGNFTPGIDPSTLIHKLSDDHFAVKGNPL